MGNSKSVLKPRAVSCGCCTGGCVCWNHQDCPRGIPPHICGYHKEHGHPGVTEEAAAVPFVDVSNIQEYGLTQKLSNSIRVF